jgi:hypothetical protein
MFHAQERRCELKGVSLKATRRGEDISQTQIEVQLETFLNQEDQALLEMDPEHFARYVDEIKLAKGLGEHMVTLQPHKGEAWNLHGRAVHLTHPVVKVRRPDRAGGQRSQSKKKAPHDAQMSLPDMPEARECSLQLVFRVTFPIVGKLPGESYQGLHHTLGDVVDVHFYQMDKLRETVDGWLVKAGVHQLVVEEEDGQRRIESARKQLISDIINANRADENIRDTFERLMETGQLQAKSAA